MFSKVASSTIFWVFGMTWPGIQLRSPGPLANVLTIMPTSDIYIYIYKDKSCKYFLIMVILLINFSLTGNTHTDTYIGRWVYEGYLKRNWTGITNYSIKNMILFSNNHLDVLRNFLSSSATLLCTAIRTLPGCPSFPSVSQFADLHVLNTGLLLIILSLVKMKRTHK